jgi:hypothetical protein
MTRQRKLGKEQNINYIHMLGLRSSISKNKIVETIEEARSLGRKKAKESGKILKLKIKI